MIQNPPLVQAPLFSLQALSQHAKALGRVTAIAVPLFAVATATMHSPLLATLGAGYLILQASHFTHLRLQQQGEAERSTRNLRIAMLITGVALGGVFLGLAYNCLPHIALALTTARPALAWYLGTKYMGFFLLLFGASAEITRRAIANASHLTSQGIQRLEGGNPFLPHAFFAKIETFTQFLLSTPQTLLPYTYNDSTFRWISSAQAAAKIDTLLRYYRRDSADGDRNIDLHKLFTLLSVLPEAEKRQNFKKIVDLITFAIPRDQHVTYNHLNEIQPHLLQNLVDESYNFIQTAVPQLRASNTVLHNTIQSGDIVPSLLLGVHHDELIKTFQHYRRYQARNLEGHELFIELNQLYARSLTLRQRIDLLRVQQVGTDILENEKVHHVLMAYATTAQDALDVKNTLKGYLNVNRDEEIDRRLAELGLCTIQDLLQSGVITRDDYANKILLRDRVVNALKKATKNNTSLQFYLSPLKNLQLLGSINRICSTAIFRLVTLSTDYLPFWIAPQASLLGVALGFVGYGSYKFYKRKIAGVNDPILLGLRAAYNGVSSYLEYFNIWPLKLNAHTRDYQATFLSATAPQKCIVLGMELLRSYLRALIVKTALKTSRVFYALPVLNGVFVGADLIDSVT